MSTDEMIASGWQWDDNTDSWCRRNVVLLDWGGPWVLYVDGEQRTTHPTLADAVRAAEGETK